MVVYPVKEKNIELIAKKQTAVDRARRRAVPPPLGRRLARHRHPAPSLPPSSTPLVADQCLPYSCAILDLLPSPRAEKDGRSGRGAEEYGGGGEESAYQEEEGVGKNLAEEEAPVDKIPAGQFLSDELSIHLVLA